MRRTDAQSAAVPMKISYFNGRVVLPQKWLTRVFLLRLGQGFAIIMPTEETALRFLRAAVAAQLHKNGSFEPLLWNSAIVAMRISTGAPRRYSGRCKVFGQFRPKPLHLSKAGNLESQGFQGFRLCSVRIKKAFGIERSEPLTGRHQQENASVRTEIRPFTGGRARDAREEFQRVLRR